MGQKSVQFNDDEIPENVILRNSVKKPRKTI